MNFINKRKFVGHFAGKHCRCPVCNSELLINRIGDRWCSYIYCDYREVKKHD